jgi:hypothetical protein
MRSIGFSAVLANALAIRRSWLYGPLRSTRKSIPLPLLIFKGRFEATVASPIGLLLPACRI